MQHGTPGTTHDAGPSSSPAAHGLLSPTRTSRRKERRPPSVTPKRFGRFFTPRSSRPVTGRRILAKVTEDDLNRVSISPQSLTGDLASSDPLIPSSPCQEPESPSRNGIKKDNARFAEPIIRRRGLTFSDMQPAHLDLSGAPGQDVLSDWRKSTLVWAPESHLSMSVLIACRIASFGPAGARTRHLRTV